MLSTVKEEEAEAERASSGNGLGSEVNGGEWRRRRSCCSMTRDRSFSAEKKKPSEEGEEKRLHMASLLHVSVPSMGCHVIGEIISWGNVSQIFLKGR